MPVIQVKDKQHTLRAGQTRIGGGSGVDVSVSDDDALGLQAILDLSGNAAVIRRARDGALVRVNGVPLGVEPTPLIHGDKVEIAGTEILFSEDKKVGATQFVSAGDIASIAAKRAGPARATSSTGGRLVSLVDGKEYQIPQAGVTFGREAGSDVVVAQPEVSRRHATIVPNETGYILTDHSTNGVWVNGTRVQGTQLLGRADVVRVGGEEFRFYADVATAKAATPAPSAPAVPPSPPAPARPPTPPRPVAAVPPPPASPPPAPSVPPVPPAAPAPPAAPVAAKPAPPPPPRAEPPTAPKPIAPPQAPPPRSAEPPTAPAGMRGSPKPAKEPTTAAKEAKSSGVPTIVWIIIIVIAVVVAYFVGQGRG